MTFNFRCCPQPIDIQWMWLLNEIVFEVGGLFRQNYVPVGVPRLVCHLPYKLYQIVRYHLIISLWNHSPIIINCFAHMWISFGIFFFYFLFGVRPYISMITISLNNYQYWIRFQTFEMKCTFRISDLKMENFNHFMHITLIDICSAINLEAVFGGCGMILCPNRVSKYNLCEFYSECV